MKILILTSLFYPEIAACSRIATELAIALKNKGHQVYVITAFPYYYSRKNRKKYRGKLFVEDNYQGIKILRAYSSAGKYKSIFNRFWSFLSFTLFAILGSLKIKGKIDKIIVFSPPFTNFFSGYIISRLKKAPMMPYLLDLYPETLYVLGYLKNELAKKILNWFEKFIYKKSKGIIVVSNGFRDNLISKGIGEEKIGIVYNWADVSSFKQPGPKNLRKFYNLDDKFIILFLGTIGYAQGLESVVRAAKILREYQEKIEFVFVGGGSKEEDIRKTAEKSNLANFTFIPPQLHRETSKFLLMADICFSHLRKNYLYKVTIPGKIYEYMAAAKPIIAGLEGESAKVIQKANCGLVVEPENPDQIARAILDLYQKDRNFLQKLGENGRDYLIANFTKDKMLSKCINFIESSTN